MLSKRSYQASFSGICSHPLPLNQEEEEGWCVRALKSFRARSSVLFSNVTLSAVVSLLFSLSIFEVFETFLCVFWLNCWKIWSFVRFFTSRYRSRPRVCCWSQSVARPPSPQTSRQSIVSTRQRIHFFLRFCAVRTFSFFRVEFRQKRKNYQRLLIRIQVTSLLEF